MPSALALVRQPDPFPPSDKQPESRDASRGAHIRIETAVCYLMYDTGDVAFYDAQAQSSRTNAL
ncbi:MAG TPA: hypothetical protein DEF05_00965 [Erwinia sp.]|nr:hypothetical protein [Erwinia sp.]